MTAPAPLIINVAPTGMVPTKETTPHIEDNIWFDRARTVHATNAALVSRLTSMAELVERPLATPADTRAMLGLPTSVAR